MAFSPSVVGSLVKKGCKRGGYGHPRTHLPTPLPLCKAFSQDYKAFSQRLVRIIKRLVRIMTFSEPLSHSAPLLKSLNLLKFSDLIHVEILSFVYQWFHKLTPSCFSDYFKQISPVHSCYTRQSNNENLFVNQVQTSQYDLRSFCFSSGILCLLM